MKKYTLNDLKPVPTAVELIKAHPEKYLANTESPANEIASHLMSDALALSARRVLVQNVNGWYLVSADKDWVRDNIDNISELSNIFCRLLAIPEKCVNSFRGEVLAYTFSSNCFVFDHGKIDLIKGGAPTEDVTKHLPKDLPFSVCFSTEL
ncbi:hypothetical protein TUM4644_18820 [Shewanella colwelliana]|uniref:hypothetical protein n=1 Tax=Shewanella colwelliana TaxID=23 RepID=UPI001BBD4691|nr:hypothetical protein [Shewanella colwelliana]GIU24405.1 hypothetical protein TUM4644_18820 [Shewanella colwelliana]